MAEDNETTEFAVGEIATFAGYKSEIPAGQKPHLKDGEKVKLITAGKDGPGSFQAVAVDDEDRQDSVFDNELQKFTEEKPAATEGQIAMPTRRRPTPSSPTAAAPAPPARRARAAAPTAAKANGKGKKNGNGNGKGKKAAVVKPAAPKAKAPKTKKGKRQAQDDKLKVPAPPEVPIKDSASVEAVLKKQDALAAAKSLKLRIDEDFFTFGGVLSHIRRDKAFETILGTGKKPRFVGVDGFREYCELELDTKPRKVLYLIDIYEHFAKLGIDEKQLTEIGWSKASQISRVADEDNFEGLLNYAKKHSKKELETHISEKFVSGGKTKKTKRTRFNFSTFNDQGKMVTQALALAGKKLEGDAAKDPNAQLVFIATDWLTVQESAEIPKKTAIAFIEQKYAIKLQEVEPKAADA